MTAKERIHNSRNHIYFRIAQRNTKNHKKGQIIGRWKNKGSKNMQRLKTIECCWWCVKNAECGGLNEKVCLAERPSIEECTECDFYKEPWHCKDFIDKRGTN
jgi:hypothetical protein